MNDRPELPGGPLVTLTYRVAPERRTRLIAFLRETFPLYERPGGIRMGLWESADEPGLVFEVVAYATREDYERDQVRVDQDPEMRAALAKWKELVGGPIEVKRLLPLAL